MMPYSVIKCLISGDRTRVAVTKDFGGFILGKKDQHGFLAPRPHRHIMFFHHVVFAKIGQRLKIEVEGGAFPRCDA